MTSTTTPVAPWPGLRSPTRRSRRGTIRVSLLDVAARVESDAQPFRVETIHRACSSLKGRRSSRGPFLHTANGQCRASPSTWQTGPTGLLRDAGGYVCAPCGGGSVGVDLRPRSGSSPRNWPGARFAIRGPRTRRPGTRRVASRSRQSPRAWSPTRADRSRPGRTHTLAPTARYPSRVCAPRRSRGRSVPRAMRLIGRRARLAWRRSSLR